MLAHATTDKAPRDAAWRRDCHRACRRRCRRHFPSCVLEETMDNNAGHRPGDKELVEEVSHLTARQDVDDIQAERQTDNDGDAERYPNQAFHPSLKSCPDRSRAPTCREAAIFGLLAGFRLVESAQRAIGNDLEKLRPAAR